MSNSLTFQRSGYWLRAMKVLKMNMRGHGHIFDLLPGISLTHTHTYMHTHTCNISDIPVLFHFIVRRPVEIKHMSNIITEKLIKQGTLSFLMPSDGWLRGNEQARKRCVRVYEQLEWLTKWDTRIKKKSGLDILSLVLQRTLVLFSFFKDDANLDTWWRGQG